MPSTTRTATWHLDGVETAGTESLMLTLSLGDNDVGSQFWPEPFHAIYTVTFARPLSLRLAVQNRATHPITFEEALHSYFAVSDVTAVAISGLAGTTYVDKTEGARRKQQTAPLVTVRAETDRVYLDTPARCAIEDGRWCRRVLIEKHGAASTVVWNPWAEKGAAMADLGDPIWRGMVCVETGNVADNEVRLAARWRTPDVDGDLPRCRPVIFSGASAVGWRTDLPGLVRYHVCAPMPAISRAAIERVVAKEPRTSDHIAGAVFVTEDFATGFLTRVARRDRAA